MAQPRTQWNVRTDDRTVQRTRASSEELAEWIASQMREDGKREVAPGLFLYRASSPTKPVYGVTDPSLCVIAQGSKEVRLGNARYRYDAAHYLLASAAVPLAGYVVEASVARPYLAIRLVLDPSVVTAVVIEANLVESSGDVNDRALTVSRLDATLLDATVRLVRLLDTPNDYRVLAPLVSREITYRLLLGEQGGRLRQIAVIDGRAHRIATAIDFLRGNYAKPLRIPGLARRLGMSISGFHHNFKTVTAMSPLQFQKQLRLQEARRLLLSGGVDAATAGYRVGYDEPSQFSREYKKLFGAPPMRDVVQLEARVTSGARRTPSLAR
jgi:AraC-like DNA-binding protein